MEKLQITESRVKGTIRHREIRSRRNYFFIGIRLWKRRCRRGCRELKKNRIRHSRRGIRLCSRGDSAVSPMPMRLIGVFRTGFPVKTVKPVNPRLEICRISTPVRGLFKMYRCEGSSVREAFSADKREKELNYDEWLCTRRRRGRRQRPGIHLPGQNSRCPLHPTCSI